MVFAIGLNALLGWFERIVAPWRAEIAGRSRTISFRQSKQPCFMRLLHA
jgi:hypothetical protein